MYIGAWTEYRLAQEQARQHAARPAIRSTRAGAGIYHPSLSEKGGMEVAGLPDRESFRRTLETALSSNLAADDAENISQALEPLMQRLPTILPAVPSKRRQAGSSSSNGTPLSKGRLVQPFSRQQKRKALNRRCADGPSGRARVHSDSGTRSVAEPTSDGTRSTRSGFSAASAPLNTAAGLEQRTNRHFRTVGGGSRGGVGVGGRCLRGTTSGGRRSATPQLPVIIDTRRRRRHAPGCGTACYGDDPPIESRPGSLRCASAFSGPTETYQGGDADSTGGRYGSPFTPTPPANESRDGGRHERDAAPVEGGYDAGAAATMLRVARRRDPAGLKADFEQFWSWKRKAKMMPVTTGDGTGPPPATTASEPSSSIKRPVRGGAISPAESKLQELARMKTVYMAKGDGGGEGENPSKSTGVSATERRGEDRPPLEPRPPDRVAGVPRHVSGAKKADPLPASSTDRVPASFSKSANDRTDILLAQKVGAEARWSGCEDGMTKPGAHYDDPGYSEDKTSTTVVVPDLELTNSQIRQVEKYFGGGGGGVGWKRRPPREEEAVSAPLHALKSPDNAGREIGPGGREAAVQIVESRAGNFPSGSGGDASRKGHQGLDVGGGEGGPIDGIIGGEAHRGWQPLGAGVPLAAAAAAAAAVAAQDGPPFASGDVVERREPVRDWSGSRSSKSSSSAPGAWPPLADGKAGARISPEDGAETGSSATDTAVAPAWCSGDNVSLEDLVYWTKGLDYDAAVKGF